MPEESRYAGRFFLAGTSYYASCKQKMEVEDLKINPDLGLLKYCLMGSNYREHCLKAVLSKGAKKIFKNIANYTLSPRKRDDGWSMYDVTVVVEKRAGRLPKIYVAKEETDALVGIVEFGSGYRGWHSVTAKYNVEAITTIDAGGSLGSCEAWLVHVKPPAAIVISRGGRLYGDGPYAYILFTKDGDGIATGSGTKSEINTYLEELGLNE